MGEASPNGERRRGCVEPIHPEITLNSTNSRRHLPLGHARRENAAVRWQHQPASWQQKKREALTNRTGMDKQLIPNDQTKTEPARPAYSPADLRCQANQLLDLSKSETDPRIKHGLIGCAFALSQLAECIARRQSENP